MENLIPDKATFENWADNHLDPDWKVAPHLHSVQFAFASTIFWSVVAGLYWALPVFMYQFSPVTFALICVAFSVALGIARLTKQPGL